MIASGKRSVLSELIRKVIAYSEIRGAFAFGSFAKAEPKLLKTVQGERIRHLIRIKMSTVLPDIHADLVPWNRHICLKRFDDFAS